MYGSKIASIRVSRGLSQESLSKTLGIKQNTLSDIESDKRKQKLTNEELENFAKALGVNVEDIKSPTPIVMNFNTNNNATAASQQYNNFDEKIKEALVIQLSTKDMQIEKLIGLLSAR